MKKINTIIICLSLLMIFHAPAVAQDRDERIEGSGNLVTKEIPVQSFDNIDLSGVYSVVLQQGQKEQVKIEADDNLQQLCIVTNEGTTLKIRMKEHSNFNSKTKMKVYITVGKLKKMDLSMVGGISSDQNLNFDELTIHNSSVGSIDLKLTAQTLHIKSSGVGHVKLTGKAENAFFTNTGVGSIYAADFVVHVMNIDNTGVGSSEVNAEKEITVRDSFLGKVRNKGNATVKRIRGTVI